MQPSTYWEKILLFFKNFQSKHNLSNCFILLFIFFIVVVFVTYIIPFLDFGRYVGTDDYSHVLYTQAMDSSRGINDFYSRMAGQVNDPEDPANAYNYPFGLWFFGSLVSKITGLTVFTGNLIGVIFFLAIIIGTFYFYSGAFLTSREQKIIAVLFMLCMPNVVMILLNYRPSVFVLPFLFMILYIALKDSIDWKQVPILWLSIFIITFTHTGTFMFLISFSLVFFLLYCLIWGKFSQNIYFTIVSSFLVYIATLNWFPEISNQYANKSTLFLTPGNFLAEKFNFVLAQDLAKIFYQNFFVGQQLIYALLLAIALYGAAQLLIYIHKNVSELLLKKTIFPAFVIPIQNISHSVAGAPVTLGPLHVLLSIPGFFRLDNKGKCVFITCIFTTFLPDLLHTAEGVNVATGALREISFLVVIIPITATLGLEWIFSYLKKTKSPIKTQITFLVWFCVLSAMILSPAVGTTYYLPKIAGENYAIDGMKWLGENGQIHEKVIGYGYRTVPVFTHMSGPIVDYGSETRLFRKLLQDIHFSYGDQENSVDNLRQIFDVRYIISSDKVLSNLGGIRTNVKIDSNQGLDKIYSSKDFGIYEVVSSMGNFIEESNMTQDTTIKKVGSGYFVQSDFYTAILNENTPILERFGTQQKNYLGDGYLSEKMVIVGSERDSFVLSDLQYSHEIKNNQILYRTILNGTEASSASLLVRYTFYPKVIKREYILSNDWLVLNKGSSIPVQFSSVLFSPLSNFIITNKQESLVRKIYESQDAIIKEIVVEDMYIFNPNTLRNAEKAGIRIKYDPSTPFPVYVSYKGSTRYDYSSISITQTASVLSGKSLTFTQFLSMGDEYTTKNNILNQKEIQLNNYPDGIDPVIVYGVGSSFSDDGYTILKNYGIPYSQVIRPVLDIGNITEADFISKDEDTTVNEDTLTAEDSTVIEDALTAEETAANEDTLATELSSAPALQMNDMRNLTRRGVGIISSANLMTRNYNNITIQKKTIEALKKYTNNQGVSLKGFLPLSFRYNLDTIKILDDNKISFMLFYPGSRLIYEGYRNPQLAYYNNTPTNVVMLPVSYPASSSLYNYENSSAVFSQWRNIFNKTAKNDEIIVFLFNSVDIGNPEYSSGFNELFSYAKEKGYTFVSPDKIADHYRQIQNIEYSGYTDIDTASITVTNNNDKMVQKVTFKVVLEELPSGNYISSEGKIVKTEMNNGSEFVYVSTDIPAHSTQNLIIKPDFERKPLQVQLPEYISEGSNVITVKDAEGNPIKNAEVILDANFYLTHSDGTVTVDFQRGTSTISIQSPGYKKFKKIIEVKGVYEKIFPFFDTITKPLKK